MLLGGVKFPLLPVLTLGLRLGLVDRFTHRDS